MKNNQTKYSWPCSMCGKRNLTSYRVQFDTTKNYHSIIECSHCGKNNVLWFMFSVEAYNDFMFRTKTPP